MAEPKLMTTYKEHMKLIQDSTLMGNYNTGQAIDPTRFRIDQAQEQFGKMTKIGYNGNNFIAEQTGPQSNYGKLK
jgi:hypothetical protein|tara:strand:- start:425 stop:649 length:225 start_codon:yes stop_codon:yes gene_type:complete